MWIPLFSQNLLKMATHLFPRKHVVKRSSFRDDYFHFPQAHCYCAIGSLVSVGSIRVYYQGLSDRSVAGLVAGLSNTFLLTDGGRTDPDSGPGSTDRLCMAPQTGPVGSTGSSTEPGAERGRRRFGMRRRQMIY